MSLPLNYKQIAASGLPPGTPGGQRLRASGSSRDPDRNKEASTPFSHSGHGNPAFTPQKIGKNAALIDSKLPKPPKPPEKPLMPYMRYSRRVWDIVKTANPDYKLWEIGKLIGVMWRELPEGEKQEFIDEHEAEKIEYDKNLKIYHQSPAYLAYLQAKNKVKASNDNDPHDTPSRPTKASQQDRRIDIQPAEDEEDQDDGYSVKHVAYARFVRNHRLINEIFSDMAVPDVRTVVTTNRMIVLRKQVQSLTMHQMKLEAELLQMEDKFESKKRKLIESSEVFQEELKKHCKPAVDDDTFHKMVERQYDTMRNERRRLIDDPNAGKQARADDNEGLPDAAPSANAATEAPVSEPEPMETDSEPTTEPEDKKKAVSPPCVDATNLDVAKNSIRSLDPEPPTAVEAKLTEEEKNEAKNASNGVAPPAPTATKETPPATPPEPLGDGANKSSPPSSQPPSAPSTPAPPTTDPPIVLTTQPPTTTAAAAPPHCPTGPILTSVHAPSPAPAPAPGPAPGPAAIPPGQAPAVIPVAPHGPPGHPPVTAPGPIPTAAQAPALPAGAHHLPPHPGTHPGAHQGMPGPPPGHGYPGFQSPSTPRSPYYPPQYNHPAQPYHPYYPYQYGPPPMPGGHYMNRPPTQGPPGHYPEHPNAPPAPTGPPQPLEAPANPAPEADEADKAAKSK